MLSIWGHEHMVTASVNANILVSVFDFRIVVVISAYPVSHTSDQIECRSHIALISWCLFFAALLLLNAYLCCCWNLSLIWSAVFWLYSVMSVCMSTCVVCCLVACDEGCTGQLLASLNVTLLKVAEFNLTAEALLPWVRLNRANTTAHRLRVPL